MDLAAARLLRLRAQGLDGGTADPASAVRRLLAVQAQDVGSPLLAIAQRTHPRASRAEVEAAFASGRVVRTWTMRGTLHAIAVEDAPWLLALTGERTLASTATMRRREGVTDDDLRRARTVAESLDDAGLRRPELLEAFRAAGVDPGGSRGYHVILALAAQGVLQVGAREDGQYRMHRGRGLEPLERDAALARLAIRYATGHGPVTDRDLAWWAAIPVTWARRAFAAAGDALEAVDVAGTPAWQVKGAEPAAPGSVLALPSFDELVIGYAERDAVLGAHPLAALVPDRNGRLRPFVAVDGRLVAAWDARAEPPRVWPLEVLPAPLLERAEVAAADASAWLAR
ncbi:winged helix DNA-binding domain-containing protein [Amnibacterium sp. CER49]|uniref:winged helix DNA-binding domain-containing protein n=1 Tax=Amnibacterium sp. CER49 TaxID=3039161 RepID=UPI00244A3E7A|nr:winged helix DNA-binding domain-containing protein [Amnibacterium sp. CER49]MDH2444618.1 winged helix DNA-binding domain-containing protein [Amnibacterium sp. CER49]